VFPIELVRLKSERANVQLRELDAQVQTFLDTKPYKVGTQRDSNTGYTDHRLVQAGDVPVDIAHIAGETVHSIRSTLDHLAYQLFLRARTDPTDEGSRIQFPIYDPSAKDAESRARGQVKGLREEVIESIFQLKPYKGADNLFWPLHKLDNISKHRSLPTVGSAFGGILLADAIQELWNIGMGPYAFPIKLDPSLSIKPLVNKCPLEKGDILFVGSPGDEEVNKKLKFSFTVALRESEVIEGKPLIETLQSMLDLATNTVSDFAPFLI